MNAVPCQKATVRETTMNDSTSRRDADDRADIATSISWGCQTQCNFTLRHHLRLIVVVSDSLQALSSRFAKLEGKL